MRRAVHAETIRLTSTPMLRRFLLGALGVGLFLTGGLILMGPDHMNPPMPGPDTADGIRGLLGVLVLSAPIPVLLGSRLMTNETEHRTVVPTLLAQPNRQVVVTAKLLAALVVGLLYGAVLAVGALVGLYGGCAAAGITPALGVATVAPEVARIGLSMALYTLIGVGIGALLPRAQLCLAVAIGWFYLAESMLSALPALRSIYPFLPGGAASAITGQSFVLDAIQASTPGAPLQLLPAWLGALVLLGYAVLASLLALATTLRRDIR
ncbi:ABC transporter permease [Luteococcus peritonei]|uniref:ABC transporter permease n=1 Tax=Luteococcus peritonei TaxID=88874 RepID=A0ABW4RZJ3_9ACTN